MKAFDDVVLFAGVIAVLSAFGRALLLPTAIVVVLFAIGWLATKFEGKPRMKLVSPGK
jgi:hypothetical protein